MSLSTSITQLINALDTMKTKIVAKMASKRAQALTANNASTIGGKNAATIKSEIEAIYKPHTEGNPVNPHNITLATIGTSSAAAIDAMTNAKLTNKATAMDFIGHPSTEGMPLTANLALGATGTFHCRLEKQPGDVLVLHVLHGIRNTPKRWGYTKVKCPRANQREPLRPLVYGTSDASNVYNLGFGDGLRVTNVEGSATPLVRKSMAVSGPETLWRFAFLNPQEGSTTTISTNRNIMDDGCYYSFDNIIGQFYYSRTTESLWLNEHTYPNVIADYKGTAGVNPTAFNQVNVGASVFNDNIADYCNFTGTVPVTGLGISSPTFRRNILIEELPTKFQFTVYTRALFGFNTYKRGNMEFFMREVYTRDKTSANQTVTKIYTSPKFNIDYETDLRTYDVYFDDIGGLAPFFRMKESLFNRTTLYKGSSYMYGYTYCQYGNMIGGKFWKVGINPDGSYDFTNAFETPFEPPTAALPNLVNSTFLGIDANGYKNYYGRSIFSKAAVMRTLENATPISQLSPFAGGGTPVMNQVTDSVILPLKTPGQAYKLFGYSDGTNEKTNYCSTRFLFGVDGVVDTTGRSDVSNDKFVLGSTLPHDTILPLALQQSLSDAIKLQLSEFALFDGVILDIFISPWAAISSFVIAYPWYADDNPDLTNQINRGGGIFTFETNVRSGNIDSWSNLNKVTTFSVVGGGGTNFNHQLKEAYDSNILCCPVILNSYFDADVGKTRCAFAFDGLPVRSLQYQSGNRSAKSDFFKVVAEFTGNSLNVVYLSVAQGFANGFMYVQPYLKARSSATRLYQRAASNSGSLAWNYTDDIRTDPNVSSVYFGPVWEFTPYITVHGILPYSVGQYSGYITSGSYVESPSQSMNTPNTSASVMNVFLKLDVDGKASIDWAGSDNSTYADTTIRTERLVEINKVNYSRLLVTPLYGQPLVGISTYFVCSGPNYRSIMVATNANI